ncbi:hypothetical protein [Paenibacillus sonchi]|uniref:hypothetical protein n=1 Tax=Paenibacillus sonchi TaxID=373687 RepID=UPI001E5F7AAF|nr:hypothetical protein [Paenibacillus sonchi]MCE3202637.1 hypothetical protein [Paenibacillus sonchi]
MKILSTLDLDNVSITCKPTAFNFESRKDSLEHFSYRFIPGKTYALVNNIGEGGWALSYLLSGREKGYKGVISIDGNKIERGLLGSFGWYVGEGIQSKAPFYKKSLTVREQLEIGTSEEHTVDKLIKAFELAPSRLDRDMKHISNERWNASIAIGLAHEKQVFCFPWLNDMWKNAILARLAHCSTILKQNKCILLIPVQNILNIENFIDDVVYLKEK